MLNDWPIRALPGPRVACKALVRLLLIGWRKRESSKGAAQRAAEVAALDAAFWPVLLAVSSSMHSKGAALRAAEVSLEATLVLALEAAFCPYSWQH